ncbi:non-ribosomal peptide synthetase/type I polyketide synthase [Chitinophaga sp. HK235]|uniref:non-ribosomal peptide synthetase/type I polyketide synthase n=1 Tax=Chitinophaga sp. HK235 TaxID=2952571 RepID=UPI0020139AF5|nr:non-ribosomal peptide synthetase/type I polyketide synthase [Chitinophaga sp. HK235]
MIGNINTYRQLPIAKSQKKIFLEWAGASQKNIHNVFLVNKLVGKIDRNALRKSCGILVNQHEVMHAQYSEDGNTCYYGEFSIDDFYQELPLDTKHSVELLINEKINASFDLTKGPLLKCFLIESHEREYYFLFVAHRIICDATSMHYFFKEIQKSYNVLSDGGNISLNIDKTFSQAVEAERNNLNGDVETAAKEFWLDYTADVPLHLDLPYRSGMNNRLADKSCDVVDFGLSNTQTAQLTAYIKEKGSTAFDVLFALYGLVLSKYTSQKRFVLGYVVDTRAQDFSNVFGCFENTIHQKFELDTIGTFSDLIAVIGEQRKKIKQYQYYSLTDVVGQTSDGCNAGFGQIYLNTCPLKLKDLEVSPVDISLNTTVDDEISLLYDENYPDGIKVKLVYRSHLFDKDLIRQFTDAFLDAVDELINKGEIHIDNYTVLSPEAYQEIVYGWNATTKTYPKDMTIHQHFEKQVLKNPDNTALIYEDQQLSYSQLNEKSNQLARHIREQYRQKTGQELKRDTPIALCLDRSLEMVISILAVLKAGGVYVPIDPSYPQQRIDFILEDTGAAMVLSHRSISGVHLPEEKVLYTDLTEVCYHSGDTANLPAYSAAGDLAYIIYTSGTTGKPKGVMIEQHQVLSFAVDNNFIDYNKAATVAGISNYAFDGSIFDIFFSLLNNKKLVIIPKHCLLDLSLLDDQVVKHNIDTAFVTTALFNSLVTHQSRCLAVLKQILFGGEACSIDVVNDFKKHFPETALIHVYGPTENIVYSSYCHLTDYNTTDVVPIGSHLSDKKLYILDTGLQPVPVGVTGELYIGGAGVARGYLNNPELTAGRFITDPFATEEDNAKGYTRLYKTGDLVRWLPDGNIAYIGRNDEQVKIRGFRIELAEIEQALLQIPGILQSCVLVKERPTVSGSAKYLVGYYVPDRSAPEAASLTPALILDKLSETLPEYMLPGSLMGMESFPLTINGKLDKRAFPDPDFSLAETYVPPVTDTEIAVCNIWEETLGLERVGLTDDFFRIGGNSILAIHVSHRMNKVLGDGIGFTAVFRHRTIAQLLLHSQGGVQVSIPRIHENQVALSFAQERLWFIEEYEKGTNAYHIPAVYELAGTTKVEGLKYALRQIVARHEVLRTTIQGRDQQGVQIVHQRSLSVEELLLTVHDDLDELLAEDINRPFDLRKEYPIRAKFYKIEADDSPERTILLINIHHIASDGWSTEIFQRELFTYYQAYMRKDSSFSLPALEIQYKDYALWQRSWLTGETLDRQLNYWKNKLSGYQPLAFPTDYPRPDRINYAGSHQVFTLNKQISDRLRSLARQHGVTLHSALLGSMSILLGKYTGQDDILIGSPIANRHYRQIQDLIGFFVNTLINRTQLSNTQSYEELVREVHQQQIEAQQHQDLPFEKLVSELGVERDLSRHPLFQIAFVVQRFGSEVPEEQQDYLKPFKGILSHEVEKFDLSVFIDDSSEEITGQISYATSLFREETIARMIQHYTYLLDALTQAPEKAYSRISLLSPDEYQEIVYGWNATEKVYSTGKTIHQYFEEQASVYPDNTALVYEDRQLSYKELNEKSNQLARHIRKQYQQKTGTELQPDTLIALCMNRSPEMIVSILAVLKAGGAYVPLDPAYPQQRVDFILEDTSAALVLSLRRDNGLQLPDEKVLYADLTEDLYLHEDIANLPSYSSAGDLAYIIYTSGTTGKPKGVMIAHKGVMNLVFVQKDKLEITPASKVLQYAALVFDASVWEIFSALTLGAQLIIVPGNVRQDTQLLSEYINKNQTTTALLPPVLLNVMSASGLPGLKTLVVGGDVSTPKLMQEWSQGRQLVNAYGPTENTVIASMHVYSEGDLHTNIGKPIENVKLYVLDASHQPVPVGITGELYIGGAGVASGYLNNPELTTARFIDNPFATEADNVNGYTRLYKTGDLVRWQADGHLEYIGRNDEQIKIRGFRIELAEIEQALLQIPGIRQSCVLVKERATTSGSAKYLVGYYVPDAASITQGFIAEQLSEVLPSYMVPDSLIAMESFPLTINGKLDKRAFPDPRFNVSETYVPPATDAKIALCRIWQELLGLEKVGITDDFFKIGGNSILAIQVSHRMNKVLGVEISVADVFKHKTIEQLLLHTLGEAQINIPRTHDNQAVLSFAQERLWFVEEYEEGTNAYHIPAVYELADTTKVEGLKHALRQIVTRHEVLRTTIQGGVQTVHQKSLAIEETLLTAQDDLDALLAEDINSPFELRKEYPIRVKFYRVQAEDAATGPFSERIVLLINIHHIASDGWSTEIFQKELFAYYQAYMRKDSSFSLPALEIQYKDYALWQRSWLTGETLDRQLNYWKNKLSGYRTLALPTDYPRPDRMNYHGAHKMFTLNKQISDRLRSLARQHGVTLHSALLGSMSILLGKYTGQDDILIGSPIANRHHRQTQDLIGFFVNTLINRTQLSNTQSYEELVREVHQQQMEAQQHQDLPFEKLVNELGVERDLSRHPLFQVAFAVQRFGSKVPDEQQTYLKPFTGRLSHEIEIFDLSVFMDDSGEEITGQFNYATSLFREETIARLIQHYIYLLDALTQAPEKAYSRLSLLSPDEYQEIVYGWNATEKVYPTGKTIHQYFEEQAAVYPDNTALVYEDRQLSYKELNEKSNQLARHIRKQYQQKTGTELQPDTLIALCMERSEEMIVSILAVLKAGGAYVPLDPAYPQQRIDFILEDTGAALVLSLRRDNGLQLPEEKVLYADLTEDLYLHEDTANLPAYSSAGDLAYIIYTSGTTGKPKGVMIAHEGVMNLVFVQKDKLEISPASKVLQYAALVFDASVWEIFSALTLGAQLIIVPGNVRQDAQLLSEYINKNQTTTALLPPVLLSVMSSSGLPGLKTLVVGGDVSTPKLMQEWSQGRQLVNAYGPTENTVIASMYVYSEGDLYTNIGKPIENVKLYVLDASHQPVPVGITGELYIGGAGVASGYLNNPELTAARFIDNPFATEADNANGYTRIYKTGDLVRWQADGHLEYIGRNDEQIKIRGFRIELAEIEQALLQVPGIRQSCVLVKERATASGSAKYLVGYYVPDAASITQDFITERLSKVLPSYMVPDNLVVLESFPLTINGKLDKRALPDPDFNTADAYVAPATELEDKLCQIYGEVLGLPGEQIGIHQNFFKIGGNSILSIQLKNKLHQLEEFKHIGAADVFKYNTIHKLIESVRGDVQTSYKLQNNTPGESHEIAIIAVSGAFSGVDSVDELWQIVSSQQEGLRFYSKDECQELQVNEALLENPDFVPVAGQVKDIELFDPTFWELSPNEARQLDPQIRKFIEHCWFALESSGYAPERRKHNIGVFAGSGESHYLQGRVQHDGISAQAAAWESFASNSKHALTTKTAYLLDLSGPATSIHTACSTGLVAVVEACQKLQLGVCDMALAGGVTLNMPDQIGYLYEEGMIESMDGHCRTFDRDSSGTTIGSGVGVVLLKRLKDAVKDQDHILGVIKGYATNNDGARKTGYTAPSVIGQTECIINAQRMAGITSDQIDYVECHGTATQLGDPIEVRALKEAFAYSQPRKKGPAHKTVLGAVKANIGHTDTAAGTAGLIKVCAMLQHNIIPGQVNFNTPNPELKLEETDFEIIKENRPWLPVPGRQRLAGVSSFGIGGTNAHVIVGDYTPDTPMQETDPAQDEAVLHIVPVSAKSRQSLENYKQALIKTCEANPLLKINDIAYTLQEKREHFQHRSAYCVKSTAELADRLKQDTAYGQAGGTSENKLVWMFSGQGVQYVNMGKALYERVPSFKNTVDYCISLANHHLDADLYKVIYTESESSPYDINETRYTQISLFIIEYALARYLEQLGIKADAYIGHSIGEYVAATLAGVFTLEDAIRLVIARGRLMQEMEAGSMLAISAREGVVKATIAQHHCEIAVINSIEDIVASGHTKDIDSLQKTLENQGISTVRLNTSHAFHCKLMDGPATAFKEVFRDVRLRKPAKTFISNLSGAVAKDEVTHPEYWCSQLRNTVQFAGGITHLIGLYNHQVNFIEIGPGKGLCYFVGKYQKTYPAIHTLSLLPAAKDANDVYQNPDSGESIIAKLWMNGIIQQPNNSKLFRQATALRSLPVYQFSHQRCWLEKANAQAVQQFNSLEELFYERTWERTDLNASPGTTAGIANKNVVVFINDRSIEKSGSAELLQLLRKHNNNVSYVVHQQENNIHPEVIVDFSDRSQVVAILHEKTKDKPLDLVIYVSPGIDLAFPALDIMAVRNVFSWSIESGNKIPKFVSVSFDNYEILGNERKQEKPSIVYGVTKSLPGEFLTLETNVFHLDLPAGEGNYESSLLLALEKNDDRDLVVVRGKYCWKPSYRQVQLSGNQTASEDSAEEKEQVFLITGGLGAVGHAYASHLTRNERKSTIILIGRTAVSDLKEAYKSRLDGLNNTHHRIIYSSIDIGQADASSQLAAILEQYEINAVDVVLHAAGVAAKSLLEGKTHEDIEQVVHPKIVGFENLLKLTATVRIDKLVCCSSLTSILPSVGNMEYAAANMYLDEVSFSNHPGVNSILTVNLNQISDAGMAFDFLNERATRLGKTSNSIKSDEFPGILETLMRFKEKNNIVLSRYHFDGSYASGLKTVNTPVDVSKDKNDIRLLDEDYTDIQYQVAQIFGEVLGVEQVSIHDDFFKIGGNSLLVIQLKNRLNQLKEFKHVGTADLFKHNTIQKLVESIRQDATTSYNLQTNTRQGDSREIAVIAVSGAFSGVANVDELWQIISSQQEGIRFYSKEECQELQVDESLLEHPDFVPVSGHVKDIELFDPLFWDLSPNEAKQLDPQIRKFIEHCWFALESAGYAAERRKCSIGVFAGSGENNYLQEHILPEQALGVIGSWEAFVSNSKHALATKTAYLMDLSGPANSINTACSTSLVTIAEACKSLQLGACDMALAGGVTLDLPDQVGYLYQEGMTHSRDGHCRTFDRLGGGTTTGSGVGVVLLKRLNDAIADQDQILAVIKGYATNNDGSRKTSYTAPSVIGQTECIINAQKMAGITSDQIDYVECHGTATHLGDPIEVQALREAFAFSRSEQRDPARKTVLGAVKANIGHPDAGAGVAGLIKLCAMLQHKIMPGQVNFNTPNPELKLEESSFEVLSANRPWLTVSGRQRLAAVSSFGVGGTNAHMIVGEYVPDISTPCTDCATDNESLHIIPVSAKSRQSLENYKQALIKACEANPLLKINDIAYTLQEKREHFQHRSAYCVKNTTELLDRLKQDTSYGQAGSADENRMVLMFPGQGVQYVNMAKALYQNVPSFKETVDHCISLANRHLDVDLYKIIYAEDESLQYDINDMRWAPISLFIIEYSLATYLEELGIRADAYIGHSLGEYVAATLAGVFALEDAIRLVVARGSLMWAMNAGGMLAINAREEKVKAIVAQHNCDIAVVNTVDDVIASGAEKDVDRLQKALEQLEIPVIRISINVAGHSRMMDDTAAKFKTLFRDIKLNKPAKPFISNLSGEIATDEVATPEYWCKQLRNTVRFAKGIDSLSKQYGHKVSFIEIGPGKGLSYFVGKYKDANNYQSLNTLYLLPSAKEANDAYLNMDSRENIIAKLWMNGIIQQPNESHVFEQATLLRSLPVYQFNHQRCWIEKTKRKEKENASTDELKMLSKEKWLSTPVWSAVSNLNKAAVKDGKKFNHTLVLLREDQLGLYDFTLLSQEVQLVVLSKKNASADNIEAGKLITLNPEEERHFEKLAAYIKSKRIVFDAIIHATSIDNDADMDQALYNSYYSLFLVRHHLLRVMDTENLIVLTNGLAQITGEDRISPANGTMMGAIRNINHEFLSMDARIIDIGDAGHVTAAVAQIWNNSKYHKSDELLAVRFGKLWTEGLESISNTFTEESLIADGDVILITGGLGNVGLAVAEHISGHHRVTFILVSRTNIYKHTNPSETTKRKIAAIERIRNNGSVVEVQPADISSPEEIKIMQEAVRQRYGNITGIIHTASGTIVDLDDYSLAAMKDAFKAKVYGIDNVLNVLELSEVKFVASTSSLASLLGDVNRIEYCAANAYLDYLSVDKKRFPGIKFIAANWNAWQVDSIETGALQGLEKLMYSNGASHEENAALFYRLINQTSYEQVAVSGLDLQQLKRELFKPIIPQTVISQIDILEKEYSEAEYQVALIFAELLGMEQISLHDDFFKIGGNSILAIQASHKINKVLGVEIKVADVFKHRTIALLLRNSKGQARINIPRTNDSQVVLSFAQERLWFIEEYEGGTNAYHIPTVYELVDVTALEGFKYALREIVARHEVLRSTIEGREHQAIQIVHEKPLAMEEVVLSGQDTLEAMLIEDINRPFDLRHAYPIRVKFYRIQTEGMDERIVMLINMHHIASDGWSMDVFQRELLAYCQAYMRKDASFSLPALEIQYKDYAQWQRSWLTGETLDRQLGYWKDRLAGYQTLVLPTDNPRPDRIDYRGGHQVFTLNKEISNRLRTLVKQQGVTLYSALLGGINILLSKYTGQNDILLGGPIANRHHRQTQDLIGFFVNTLVSRTLLDNTQSYEALIRQVHQQQMDAQQHQDLPFEKLVNELGVERDLSRHPLFQVAFALQSFGSKAFDEHQISLKPYEGVFLHEVEKFDLSIFMDDSNEEITGQICYAISLFREETISRLIQHYTYLLDVLTQAPEKAYSTCCLLSPEEYQQIVYERNASARAYPGDINLYQHFEAQVLKNPDNIALVYEDQQLSYHQLNEKSNQLARHIREQYRQKTGQELKRDTLIALCLDRSLEMVISILAVLKAGGAYVPMDPSYPQQRIDFILEDTGAAIVLSHRRISGVHLPEEKVLYTDLTEACYHSGDTANLPAYSAAHDLAYIIYTSGTSGNPKGVMIEQHQVLSFAVDNNFIDYDKAATVAGISNYAFDGSIFDIFFSLLNNKKLVIIPKHCLLDLPLLDDQFVKHNIDTTFVTTSLFNSLATHQSRCLAVLKQIFVGGEACSIDIVNDFKKHFPETSLTNAYGPTENIVFSSYCHLTDYNTAAVVPIGSHLSDKKLYILDTGLQPVPVNVIGELYIGGAGVARGYLNNPELTAERFIDNPFATEEDNAKGYTRLYKTGDLVKWLPDGNIAYVGRNDEQVKIRGFRIELAEIEQALLQVPGILQSCVLVKERPTVSGSAKYLVGYFVPDRSAPETASLTQDLILHKLSETLPEYMLPGSLMAMESFPLTANGKLDRRALPDPEFNVTEQYVPPVTDTEIASCGIWQEVLGLEKVGTTDDFFKIGGNSILAIQVSHRMSRALGAEISVADVFVARSIGSLLRNVTMLTVGEENIEKEF